MASLLSFRKAVIRLALGATLLAVPFGCSSTPEAGGGTRRDTRCEAGQSVQCVCRDGKTAGTRYCDESQVLGECLVGGVAACPDPESDPSTIQETKVDSGAPAPECPKLRASDACNPVVGCGCKTNETCAIAADGKSTSCVAAGTHATGQSCTTSSDCSPPIAGQPGLVCAKGVCRQACDNIGNACPGVEQRCMDEYPKGGEPRFGLCSVACDPETNVGCGTSTYCVWDATSRLSNCVASRGNKEWGATCAGATECGADLVCVPDGKGVRHCEVWCSDDLECWNPYTADYGYCSPLAGRSRGVCLFD